MHDTAESGFDDGSDLSPDHKPEAPARPEALRGEDLASAPTTEGGEEPRTAAGAPKLDYKSEVLDELSKFAEEEDTSIYTGPTGRPWPDGEMEQPREEDPPPPQPRGESYIKTSTLRKPPTSSKKSDAPRGIDPPHTPGRGHRNWE